MEEPVKTRVKLHKNGVELVRSGAISTTMILKSRKNTPPSTIRPTEK